MRAEMLLREALSSTKTPFAKLIRQGQPYLSAHMGEVASPPVNGVDSQLFA